MPLPQEEKRERNRIAGAKWRAANRERSREIDRRSHAKNREKRKTQSRNWRTAHPEGSLSGRLKRAYGISVADYRAMHVAQEGKCACCGAVSGDSIRKGLFVDHCHATGKIRGLLCHRCNIGMGALGDTAARVRKAVEYLERAEVSRAA